MNGDIDRRRFLRMAQSVCALAAILWSVALVLFGVIVQTVSYTVCEGSLIRFPPPSIHWPPEGQNLNIVTLQHDVTLSAAAVTILAAFLLLYAKPEKGAFSRTMQLLASVGGSLVGALILWLLVEQHNLSAQVDALARCL